MKLSLFLKLMFIFSPSLLFAQTTLNVLNFGAKADGKSDATKAIQAAINSANPSVKTIIYFPTGTYKIGEYTVGENYLENYCLKMHSNLEFRGQSAKTIIRLADHLFDKADKNANAHLFYGNKVNNISFSNFCIDMNGQNNLVPKDFIKNNAGVFIYGGNTVRLEKITIKNCAGTNMINIMSKGSGLIINDCSFINGGNYVGSNSLINKNQIDFSFIYSEWENTHITNCTIEQQNIDIALANYTGGIEIHDDSSSIVNCTITGCYPAIYITSSSKAMNQIKISNTRMINCAKGVSFWLIFPMQNIIIEDNVVELTYHTSDKSNLAVGIEVPNGNENNYTNELANAAPISNLSINRNTIKAKEMKNLSAGIILHSLKNSTITGNTIEGMNYAGIGFLGSKWGSQAVSISDNSFIDFNPNQSEQTVAGYIIITDSYSPSVKNAPGLKNIVFKDNHFNRSSSSKQKGISQKGKFFGAFIALPDNMINEIQFQQNSFSDKAENVYKVRTN